MPMNTGESSRPAMLNTYRARVEEPGSGVLGRTIEAAYFVTEDDLIMFKDGDHKAVYAVRRDCLLSVERIQLNSDDSSS